MLGGGLDWIRVSRVSRVGRAIRADYMIGGEGKEREMDQSQGQRVETGQNKGPRGQSVTLLLYEIPYTCGHTHTAIPPYSILFYSILPT